MKKALVVTCVLTILHIGWSQLLQQKPIRFRRDAGHSPAEDGSHIVVRIKDSIEHLRHAEARLKTFIERVEEGLKNSTVVKALQATHEKVEKVELDLTRIAALNISSQDDHVPKTFRDLIKRISFDTHILLDQLHGHFDSLADHIQHDSDEDSFEEHHEAESS